MRASWVRQLSQSRDSHLNRVSEQHADIILQAFSPYEAKDYLTRPGYLQLENGWSVAEDGTLMIAILTDIGNGNKRCHCTQIYQNDH